ncbi:hypothetical protein, partial [Aerococcus sp. L_32]|uniref:hypothetical protein n=1 Tax=Aerococcus sp. L_32 TaxID=3422316 RepID=UPI003D6AE781
ATKKLIQIVANHYLNLKNPSPKIRQSKKRPRQPAVGYASKHLLLVSLTIHLSFFIPKKRGDNRITPQIAYSHVNE